MIPYGIIIKQNRASMQQSYIFWQKNYGLLTVKKFLLNSIPLISAFAVVYCAVAVLVEREFSAIGLFSGILMNMAFVLFLMYATSLKTVKEYALVAKEEKVQLVLTEDCLEITTAFSKEIVPYSEIEICFEKNFLLTIITDKNAFPLSISKMCFEKGDYDTFVALLKNKAAHCYVKKGDC